MTPTFVSAARLSSIVIALLAVAALLALADSFHNILGVDLQGRLNTMHATQADAASFNSLMYLLSWSSLGLTVVCGIAFMRWQWRSLNNAFHLDAGEGISSPRMAVVAWFIPLYNLVRPYQIVIDLHDRMLAPLRSTSGRWLIRTWWAMWLLGTVVGEIVLLSARSSGSSPTGLDRLGTMSLLAVLSAVRFADAILAIAVVRQVQRLANARELARRGQPAQAIELVARSQQARVTRVPAVLAVAAIAALVAPLGAVYASASAAPSWIVFQPADKSFTVSMPVTPLETPIAPYRQSGMTLSGDVFQSGEKGTLAFIITYYEYPTGSLSSTSPTLLLDRMQSSMASLGTIESTVDRTVSGHPGREIRVAIGGARVRAIACIDGDRAYVAEVDYTAAEASSPDIDRFLGSFTLP